MRCQRLGLASGLLLALIACDGRESPATGPSPAPPPAPTNLLTNGSFEVGPPIPGSSSYTTLRGASTAIPGWTVTGGSIDYIGTFHPVSDGQRAIDLDGAFSTGGIRQAFTTRPGAAYLASFDLSGNPDGGPSVKNVRVTVDAVGQDFSFNVTGQTRSNLSWVPREISFVATGVTATISFASQSSSGNSWGAFIDNVRVVER